MNNTEELENIAESRADNMMKYTIKGLRDELAELIYVKLEIGGEILKEVDRGKIANNESLRYAVNYYLDAVGCAKIERPKENDQVAEPMRTVLNKALANCKMFYLDKEVVI